MTTQFVLPFLSLRSGPKAAGAYQGDALSITASAEGAATGALGFQKLLGRATTKGFWLESTEATLDKLRLTAETIGRADTSGNWLALFTGLDSDVHVAPLLYPISATIDGSMENRRSPPPVKWR